MFVGCSVLCPRKVLDRLRSRLDLYHKPYFRVLRKSIMPFVEDARGRLFAGDTPDEYTEKKRRYKISLSVSSPSASKTPCDHLNSSFSRKLEQHARKQRQAAMDHEHIRKTELRSARIAALEALKEAAPANVCFEKRECIKWICRLHGQTVCFCAFL